MAWNILLTKTRINSIIPSSSMDTVCLICKAAEDSLQHLFFNCFFALFVWQNSSWPLDSLAFGFSSMRDWVKLIISPETYLNIPLANHHRFQIFAAVACDLLWFYRNKAYHDGIITGIHHISKHINIVTLEHFHAWHLMTSLSGGDMASSSFSLVQNKFRHDN